MKTISRPCVRKVTLALLTATLSVSCVEESGITARPGTPALSAEASELKATRKTTAIDLSAFRTIASSLFSSNLVQADQAIVKYQTNYLYFNFERLIRQEATKLNSYFKFPAFDFAKLAREVDLVSAGVPFSGQQILVSQVPGSAAHFTSEQLGVLDAFVGKMYSATDAASAAIYYKTTVDRINQSVTMTTDDKILLLSVAEVANEFAKNFFSGKLMGINADIQQATGLSLSGCSVNWRSVWAAGVVGGVVGAVFGAKAGAAGGTIAFPGLGTATGVVGGGVIGFATGFIGGVGTGVATELLTSCFRAKAVQNMALYCKYLPAYLRTPLDKCSVELYDKKIIFSLRDLME